VAKQAITEDLASNGLFLRQSGEKVKLFVMSQPGEKGNKLAMTWDSTLNTPPITPVPHSPPPAPSRGGQGQS
jgi:hypothetical protein